MNLIPYLAFYSDDVPPSMAGKANGPIIRIHTRFREDKSILVHEIEHVKQWWMWVLLSGIGAAALWYMGSLYWFFAFLPGMAAHPFLYGAISAYRQWSEVSAYRAQAKSHPGNRNAFYAAALTTYGLGLTQEQALTLMEKP